MTLRALYAGFAVSALTFACFAQAPPKKGNPLVKKQAYGKMPDGAAVDLYTLTNANGMEVHIITFGGIVTSLMAPDRAGKLTDVVLGMDTLEGYLSETQHFGALIGRYGNRIGNGQFRLDGHVFTLPKNDGENTLHGRDARIERSGNRPAHSRRREGKRQAPVPAVAQRK
jgi:aldose 1-epimerase